MDTDVLIVGAGAAGLYLATRLRRTGRHVTLLERRSEPTHATRAIGIHPPGQHLLAGIGCLEAVAGGAEIIRAGRAFSGARLLGRLPLPPILSVPQSHTEAVLRAAAGGIRTGVTYLGHRERPGGVEVETDAGALSARILIGADGWNSAVRQHAHIAWTGGAYPFSFSMADTPDDTGFGPDAVLFLSRHGMVECFPLPAGRRRWVVLHRPDREPGRQAFLDDISERCGRVPPLGDLPVSSYRTYGFSAEAYARGPVRLVGDAAHVTSPIGGQGMTLGWLNADRLMRLWDSPEQWNRQAKALAATVIRRAEWNMRLGGPTRWPGWRNRVVRVLLAPPFATPLARRFAMVDLPAG